MLKQDYLGNYKILIVDDASQDHTGKIVRDYKFTLPITDQNRLEIIATVLRLEVWSGKL